MMTSPMARSEMSTHQHDLTQHCLLSTLFAQFQRNWNRFREDPSSLSREHQEDMNFELATISTSCASRGLSRRIILAARV